MIPWLWHWAPQFRFPWSGSVTQDISPDTSWFFSGIPPEAGNGDLEKEIFEGVASYGRQLGLILEVLLSLTGEGVIDRDKAQESLTRLKEIHEKMEKVKRDKRQRIYESAVEILEKLRANDADAFDRLIRRFKSEL